MTSPGRFMRRSLLFRFSLLSLAVLLCIALGLGWILQRQMERTALTQQADEIAVVIDSMMGRQLTAQDVTSAAGPEGRARWQSLAHRLLGADRHLVRIKVWDDAGRVIYSNNPAQVGKRFPISDELRTALDGQRAMDVSNLTETENVGDRQGHSSLLETYIPMRAGGRVVGAYEAYSDLGALNAQLDDARRTLWGSVALGFLLLYASLFAIVRGASRRLVRQMRAISALEVEAREAAALREVDRLKDEFIGGISHELRRPLASIKGYTASLLLPNSHWEPEVEREFLEVIDEESDHLALLIDNLLDLARLGSGSLQLNLEPLNRPIMCEEVVRRVRMQSHLPPHEYGLHFADQFPYVKGDHARMTQLLLNLLENAAKYSPVETPIVVEGHAEGGQVVVSVIDQGPGLTAEQAEHVFDKFYRVDSGLTRATEGTGLGLALCRGVVEAHGGEITVTSKPGEGCRFTVRLPGMAQEVATPPVLQERGA
jgi:signal transduction histidine kinase